MSNTSLVSSYWLDDEDIDILTGKRFAGAGGKDIFKLASYQRAIANFVKLVTGDDSINVAYDVSGKGQSYTNGKKIVISAGIDSESFDSNVGLALHEASHCILTNFELLKKLLDFNGMRSRAFDVTGWESALDELFSKRSKQYLKFRTDDIECSSYLQIHLERIKDILNYVEDRRIDLYMFQNARGYNGYYQSMYEKYFNNKVIDKALKSTAKREETYDNYMFRIINFTNPNRDLKALKGLQKIYDIVNFKKISRLSTTMDALLVSIKIYDTILDYIPNQFPMIDDEEQEQQKTPGQGQGQGGGSDEQPQDGTGSQNCGQEDGEDKKDKQQSTPNMEDAGTGDGENDDKGEDTDDDGETADGSEEETSVENGAGGGGGNETGEQEETTTPGDYVLKKSEIEALEKAIKKQQEFNSATQKKKQVSKKELEQLEVSKNFETDIVNVGKNYDRRGRNMSVGCLVIQNVTQSLIDSNMFKTFISPGGYRYGHYDKFAQRGMILGKLLGTKLKVRNEERNTIYNRLAKGKIDSRMISSLGYGAENVFYSNEVSNFNPAVLHISIDGSGSMSGQSFGNTILATVAICQAAKMISGLDVEVSYRTTENSGGRGESPAIFYLYKSRRDTMQKFLKIISTLDVNGSTPEGLCFEAILKNLTEGNANKESYFINFSDGEPGFSTGSYSYCGDRAISHTRKMVDQFRAKGISVLSYFINNYGGGSASARFKQMYGDGARFVKVDELVGLAKTLNDMFTKNNKN